MFEPIKFLLKCEKILLMILSLVHLRDKLVTDYIYQRRLNGLKLRKMKEQSTCHEVQLLRVSVLGVLACLVVDHVGFIAVHNDQIDDTPIPNALIKEGAGFVTRHATLDAKFKFRVLLTRDSR